MKAQYSDLVKKVLHYNYFFFLQKYLNKETNNVLEALFGIQKQIASINLSYELITFAQNLETK